MPLGRILRQKRAEFNLTLEEVSSRAGCSKPYLSTIETGRVKNPPSDGLLRKLENILSFEPGLLVHIAHLERLPYDIRHHYESTEAENQRWRRFIRNLIAEGNLVDADARLAESNLQTDSEKRFVSEKRLVPVINRVAAGYPVDFNDLDYPVGIADDYVTCPDLSDPHAFAVRVVGDSMEPKFAEGDIVIFSPAAEVSNGDDCFVRFEMPHETTFKRVFFETDNNVRLQPRNENYSPIIVKGRRINGIYKAVIKYQRL